MDAYIDLWKNGTWWIVFVVSTLIGLAGAFGLLDRAEASIDR